MEKFELKFFTKEILIIIDHFIKVLNEIKLNSLSSDLYELINVINIIKKDILNKEFILENNLIEIKKVIDDYIIIFLKSINNDQKLVELIQTNYNSPINILYSKNKKLDAIKYKYLKYKKKYNQLKNK